MHCIAQSILQQCWYLLFAVFVSNQNHLLGTEFEFWTLFDLACQIVPHIHCVLISRKDHEQQIKISF